MVLSLIPGGRAVVIACLVLAALSACGRRGALEAPPDPAVAKSQTQQPGRAQAADEDDEAEAPTLPSATPTPRKGPRRGYSVPKEPFVLDPLL